MGISGIGVLYRNTSSVEIEHRIYRWIRKVASIIRVYEGSYGHGFGFYVRNGAIREFPDLREFVGCRLTLTFSGIEADDVELLTIESCVGYFPDGQIEISAGCNSLVDSITICEIACHIASDLDGFIQLGGMIQRGMADAGGAAFHIPSLNAEGSYNYYTLVAPGFLMSLLSRSDFSRIVQGWA